MLNQLKNADILSMGAEFNGLPDFQFIEKSNALNIYRVNPYNPDEHAGADPERHARHHHHTDEARDHFEQLAQAAKESNVILVKNRSPYRFCVYRNEAGGIFIDIVTLAADGKISTIRKKDITHDEFKKWLRHIEEREGLFLDETA